MINREALRWPPLRAALVALVLAVCTAGATLVRAVRPNTLPASAPPALPNLAALAVTERTPAVNIGGAVAQDLFAPDRAAPAGTYRLGEESDASTRSAPKPIVLGTAVAANGRSFATCQLGSARPLIVHVGDHLGDYTVKRIDRTSVVFSTAAGTSLDVHALSSGN